MSKKNRLQELKFLCEDIDAYIAEENSLLQQEMERIPPQGEYKNERSILYYEGVKDIIMRYRNEENGKVTFDYTKIKQEIEKSGIIEKVFKQERERVMRETFEEIRETIQGYDEVIEDMIRIRKSHAYLERLANMLGGDYKKAERLRRKMVRNIQDKDYYISNFPHNTSWNTIGRYVDGKVFLPYDGDNETGNVLISGHEMSHKADKGGKLIPQREEDLLKEKHTEKTEKDFWKSKWTMEGVIYDNYLSDPTEILARKAVFDIELQDLGIKKYEEKFTEKHYEKVKKLLEEGKLDRNSSEFFRMFEKDALIMIMNTVAYQDWKEKGVPIDQGKPAKELVAKILKVDELNKKGDTYYPPEFWVRSDTELG